MGGDDKRKENNFAVLQNPNTFCWLIHCPQVKFGKWDNRQGDTEEICTRRKLLQVVQSERLCPHSPQVMVNEWYVAVASQ